MAKNRKEEKLFIKEALKTRNYFSYRTDLILYKSILSVLVGTAIYMHTYNSAISVIIGAETFAIFTLVNKLALKRKMSEGGEKLIKRMKMEHFKKKLEEINQDDFEMLIIFLFEKNGYMNFIKNGRRMFLAEKDGLINYIKIYKFYDNMELEKIDLRNFVSFMCQNNIGTGHLITTGKLSEEAEVYLNSFNEKLDIHIAGMDELFTLMEENGILPDNEYFYNKICVQKILLKKREVLEKNIFGSKKVYVYILASIFFYITSVLIPKNVINSYISYYFILLAAISIVHMVWNKYISAEKKGKISH